MQTVVKKNENGAVMYINGRIDTMTSAKLQEEILNIYKNEKSLVLDFIDVTYVSSAGLRALLIGQKTAASKGGVMELQNVSDAVMSVLNSVGFSKILSIK
jgi:anti-anti-sigma factor